MGKNSGPSYRLEVQKWPGGHLRPNIFFFIDILEQEFIFGYEMVSRVRNGRRGYSNYPEAKSILHYFGDGQLDMSIEIIFSSKRYVINLEIFYGCCQIVQLFEDI